MSLPGPVRTGKLTTIHEKVPPIRITAVSKACPPTITTSDHSRLGFSSVGMSSLGSFARPVSELKQLLNVFVHLRDPVALRRWYRYALSIAFTMMDSDVEARSRKAQPRFPEFDP